MVILEETFVPELESKAQDLIKNIENLDYRKKVDKEARKIIVTLIAPRSSVYRGS